MPQDVRADGFDILGRDESAALQEGVGFGGHGQSDGGAGGGAVLDLILYWQFVGVGLPGGEDDVQNVIADFFIDVDLVHDLSGFHDVAG